MGYVRRLVECTNQKEEDVVCSYIRLLVALIEAGHSYSSIRKMITLIKNEVLFKITNVSEEAMGWSVAQRREFRELYDRMRHEEMEWTQGVRKGDRC